LETEDLKTRAVETNLMKIRDMEEILEKFSAVFEASAYLVEAKPGEA